MLTLAIKKANLLKHNTWCQEHLGFTRSQLTKPSCSLTLWQQARERESSAASLRFFFSDIHKTRTLLSLHWLLFDLFFSAIFQTFWAYGTAACQSSRLTRGCTVKVHNFLERQGPSFIRSSHSHTNSRRTRDHQAVEGGSACGWRAVKVRDCCFHKRLKKHT